MNVTLIELLKKRKKPKPEKPKGSIESEITNVSGVRG